MENGKSVDTLRLGSVVDMEIHVDIAHSANYFMLEAPLPAGCTYAVQQRRSIETHREEFRDKCVFYFEHLPKGKHTFTVPLEVRYAGHFHVNPVRLGSMYFKHIETFTNSKQVRSGK